MRCACAATSRTWRTRGDDALGGTGAQRLDVAVDGAGQVAEPLAMRSQSSRVSVGMRSKISRISCAGAGDDVEVALVQPRLVALELERELAAEVGDGDRSTSSAGSAARSACERRPDRLDRALVPGGRVVGEPVVGRGAPDVGADGRIQLDEGVDPVLGDAVDVGRGALTRCHAASL